MHIFVIVTNLFDNDDKYISPLIMMTKYASKYSRIVSLFCLIFSDIKMLLFRLSLTLYVLQLLGRNGFTGSYDRVIEIIPAS